MSNVPMKRYTSMRVGGPVNYVFYPDDGGDLYNVISMSRQNGMPIRFLGNGTNVIVDDRGLDETIIRITKMRHLSFFTVPGSTAVEAPGGLSLSRLIKASVERGLCGLEKLYGIPGTVAGAVKMNAGSFGVTISDHLQSVRCMGAEGTIKEIQKEECGFGYRTSLFSSSEAILSARFMLKEGSKEALAKEMERVWEERWKKHPMELPSAGSIFKNKEGRAAWRFIDEAGLRGFRMGGACISEKHPNFIVNMGNATAADVVNLIRKVKKEVYEKTGIRMDEEVELWGFNE